MPITQTIYAKTTVSMTDLRRNPSKIIEVAGDSPIAGVGARALADGAAHVGEYAESGLISSLRNIFAPEMASKEASAAAEVTVEMMARAARESAVSAENLSKFNKVVAGLSKEQQLDFMRGVLGEGGREVPTELKPMQEVLRAEYDKRQRELMDLGILERFNENYAHLLWKDPKKAEEFFPRGVGRSIGGSPTSLRAKTLATIDEGLARGLELATTNPLELAMHSITESDRFITARRMVGKYEKAGVIKEILCENGQGVEFDQPLFVIA